MRTEHVSACTLFVSRFDVMMYRNIESEKGNPVRSPFFSLWLDKMSRFFMIA